jgi:hypothetical protein
MLIPRACDDHSFAARTQSARSVTRRDNPTGTFARPGSLQSTSNRRVLSWFSSRIQLAEFLHMECLGGFRNISGFICRSVISNINIAWSNTRPVIMTLRGEFGIQQVPLRNGSGQISYTREIKLAISRERDFME